MFDVEDAVGSLDAVAIDQLTEYLAATLTSAGSFSIVPRSQIRERLRQEKTESVGACYDDACQIELGKAVAASKTISTKLLRVGGECAIVAMLFDLQSETAERGTTVETGCGPQGLFEAMSQVALRLSR